MSVPESTEPHERQGSRSDIEIANLPMAGVGEPLIPHEVYIDVFNPGQGPFRALEGQTAGSGNGYVGEKDVDPQVWDHLVRMDGEARLRHEQELKASVSESHPVEPGVSDIGHSH